MKIIAFALIMISSIGFAQNANTLTIDFTSKKHTKGKIYVAVYNKENSFLKKPYKGTIVRLENGKARAIIEDLPKGDYAASSFYDKNNNGKLDTNFLGIPKEPTAMSNGAKARFGPPKYKDAKFKVTEDTIITINFK